MRKKLYYTLLMLLSCSFIKADERPSPFNIENVLPLELWGWFSVENQENLAKLIKETKPKKIVEIGTFLGLSAIFMAHHMTEPGQKLYCVDPWQPYPEMAAAVPEANEKLLFAYEQFLSNCIHHNVYEKIIPMRMTSMQAVQLFSNDVDLIYIDGSHDEEDVYDDIVNWYPKLSPNGIMCGDDWSWTSVHKAIERALKVLNVKVKSMGNFWWFEK